MRTIEEWRSLKTYHRKIALIAAKLTSELSRPPNVDEITEAYVGMETGKFFPIMDFLAKEVELSVKILQETGFASLDSEYLQVHYETLSFLKKSKWSIEVPEPEIFIHFRRKASWPSLGLADVLQMRYGDFVVNVMDNDDFSLVGALPGDIVAFRPSTNNSDKLMSLEFDSATEKVKLIISSNSVHNDSMPIGIVRNLQ